MENTGICRLCLAKKKLLKKSHILPKFFLTRSINKNKKGFVVMSVDTSVVKNVPDNAYEANILCHNCDNVILSQFEDYASKFLYGGLGRKDRVTITPFQLYHEVKNINYHKLKLFVLSLLWKCSISKTFAEVNLSLEQEEEIRLILMENKFISENHFPVSILSYAHLKEVPNEIIFSPYISKKEKGEQNFLFFGGGLLFQIIVEYQQISPINLESMLKESGEIKLIQVPSESMKSLINNYVGWDFLKSTP